MKRVLKGFLKGLVVVLLVVFAATFIVKTARAVFVSEVVANIDTPVHASTTAASWKSFYTALEQLWNDLSGYYESVEQGLNIAETLSTVKSTLDTINKYYDFYKEVNDRIDTYKNYNLDKLQRDVSYKLDRRYPEVRYVVSNSEYVTDGKKKSRYMSDGRMKEVIFGAYGDFEKVSTAAEASTKIIAANAMIEASNTDEYLKELKESVDDYNNDVAKENSPGKAQQLTAQAVGVSNAIAVENLALDADRNRLIAADLLNKTKTAEASTKVNTYVYSSIAENPTGLKKDDLKWRQ